MPRFTESLPRSPLSSHRAINCSHAFRLLCASSGDLVKYILGMLIAVMAFFLLVALFKIKTGKGHEHKKSTSLISLFEYSFN